MSNDTVLTAAAMSSGAAPGPPRIPWSMATKERCSTATPFGVPVEPDV